MEIVVLAGLLNKQLMKEVSKVIEGMENKPLRKEEDILEIVDIISYLSCCSCGWRSCYRIVPSEEEIRKVITI